MDHHREKGGGSRNFGRRAVDREQECMTTTDAMLREKQKKVRGRP